jgi:hypothetical protein
MRSGLFLMRNLDDPNRFEMAGEFRSLARRVLRRFSPSGLFAVTN